MNVSELRNLTVGELLDALVGARAESEHRSRLIPIKSAPVAYRTLLDAERAGELTIYRVGKASFVERAELEEWIMRSGAPKVQSAAVEERDEIADIIALQRRRRA